MSPAGQPISTSKSQEATGRGERGLQRSVPLPVGSTARMTRVRVWPGQTVAGGRPPPRAVIFRRCR
jgi:hypothetical protein